MNKPINSPLIDSYGRQITYLRLSVTDRCDLRCTYCMAENMTFLPKRDLLTLEELDQLASHFIARGVRKIRITGGEPLVRRDIMHLIKRLGRHRERGALDELTVTTNGTQLSRFADDLKRFGVERINVSLDTLDRALFKTLTRRDAIDSVMQGIDAAQAVGLRVKINTVALQSNADEIADMMVWAHGRGMDMTLIEVMPLGEIDEDRVDQYIPLSEVRDRLAARFTLSDIDHRTGGPARYVSVKETAKGKGGRLGFITPLTNNFCAGCNRVRVTCTGQIYSCLGHGGAVDLRSALRGEAPQEALNTLLDSVMRAKPERHNFDISKRGQGPSVQRYMSVTGG
ncbi:GTP 3',8-cyclase MoaA [Fretibacter rubidus]|uniref:GTP 3',8-cyclase MoaA n=1 Tax=Fretibacter rubidus TaxID=570162 RepID=UPI00352B55EE